MNLEKYKISFIGFGHLAEIIFNQLIMSKMVEKAQCTFVRKSKQKQHNTSKRLGIIPSTLKKAVLENEIIFFCVPPQNIHEVFESIKNIELKDKLLISLLAGTTIQTFEEALGHDIQIMRALPNAPSMIGEGLITVCFNRQLNIDYKTVGTLIFTALGQVIELDEKYMDVACGIGASGPAYIFKLIEAAAQLGVEKGLPYPISLKISAQMFAGASKLVCYKQNVESLVESIASPQGTTQAGLNVYDQVDLSRKFQDVLNEAIERSRELSR